MDQTPQTTQAAQADRRKSSWLQRRLLGPVVRMLRHGASPRRLAWSIAIGIIVGINPVLGSTTLATIAVAHLLRLNHTAAQVGAQGAYPLQLLLLVPFLRAGTLLFGAAPLPLQGADLVSALRQHPAQMVQFLWTWEWHALLVWAAVALLVTPLIALPLRYALEHTRARRERLLAG